MAGIMDFFTRSRQQRAKEQIVNKFNEAFFKMYGVNYTAYDPKQPTYVDQGYNYNPIVRAVVDRQAIKTSSIPFCVKKIEDKQAKKSLESYLKSTEYNPNYRQKVKAAVLESKAYSDDVYDMPLERPNPNQTWNEFVYMYKVFMKLTGNFYIYKQYRTTPQGVQGELIGLYILPSQYVEIVTKGNQHVGPNENVIDYYKLTYGGQWVKFNQNEITHIKYGNPNHDTNGEQLYGLSPIKSILKNIQSTNTGLDLNIKTLKSGGAFGFFYGKNSSLRPEQAKSFKDQLKEMQSSPEELAKIAGSSAEMGFQRISLTSDELKPFDYFQFDEKQICNVLRYSDKLLNNDGGSNYGEHLKEIKKSMITDDIAPDLKLLEQAFNTDILSKIKGYEGTCIVFEYNELPEMQVDVVEMSKWLNGTLDRGVIDRDEYRAAIGYAMKGTPEMQALTVQMDVIPLKDALETDMNFGNE